MHNRVLVVDHNQAIRAAVRLICACEGVDTCGEAENGREAIAQVHELHPDLVILDIAMPVMNGLTAAHEIRRVAPRTKILFFSMYDAPKSRVTARLIAADAFVRKDRSIDLGQELRRLLNVGSEIRR